MIPFHSSRINLAHAVIGAIPTFYVVALWVFPDGKISKEVHYSN